MYLQLVKYISDYKATQLLYDEKFNASDHSVKSVPIKLYLKYLYFKL